MAFAQAMWIGILKLMAFWLMKSEPDTYSIDDLERDKVNMWEGCRNYTVRNFMRDKMKPGDQAFFYHSNSDPIGIVGIMEVVDEPFPDPTQFDPGSEYFDPKSPKENPRWLARNVKYIRKMKRVITLAELKSTPGLEQMGVVQKFQRLSVMPVTDDEWNLILKLESKG
jgi:predicted RNA-binding protein with PUA-like domain